VIEGLQIIKVLLSWDFVVTHPFLEWRCSPTETLNGDVGDVGAERRG
jgi:hypothetical protein